MFVAAIWLWPAIFNVVRRVLQGRLEGWDPASPGELFFTFGDWITYAAVTPVIFAISERWPVVRPHVARRFAIHMGFALLFCVAWAVVGKALQGTLFWFLEREQFQSMIADAGENVPAALARNVASWILTTLPFGVVVYSTVAGMAHAINYFTAARDREVQLARISEQLTGARFAALQAQLNPHFMFNTLNTIAVLIRDGDRDGAVRIVERLSELLRRTLRRHRATEVTLANELGLIEQYVAIEQARFPDRLHVVIDIPGVMRRAMVPAFAVQHLVENAIRHGIARKEVAGVVRVRASRDADDLVVEVEDDGPGIRGAAFPAGHGITTTRERLAALHGERSSLDVRSEAGRTVATLRVPFREGTPEDVDDGE
jgi:signal transduction histidine kinase